jgi:glycosyltransferase involved in cell wall biosynthesis
MKILIVMAGFFPGKKYGGPPVSIDNFCSLMKDEECFIVTSNHDFGDINTYPSLKNGWNDRGNCKVLYVSDDEYNKATFEKTMIEIKPDIIYLQGLFQSCVIPCLQLAKKYSIPVLIAPRGELCAGALNIKKWKKMPYIKVVKAVGLVKNIHWQSTSDEETEAIERLMKADDVHIHRLDNIPSIPKKVYPRREKKVGEGRFVFLSRIHPKKNLLSAIKYFKYIEGKAWFDIYGPIEDEEYWKHCQDEIERLPGNVKVEYKGLVSHDQVHEIFSQYDAFLFPTLSENYGHVIAESLIVGTPVIISDQTPWTDVEEYGAGYAISLSDHDRFKTAIRTVINRPDNCVTSTVNYIDNKLRINDIKENYVKELKFLSSK